MEPFSLDPEGKIVTNGMVPSPLVTKAPICFSHNYNVHKLIGLIQSHSLQHSKYFKVQLENSPIGMSCRCQSEPRSSNITATLLGESYPDTLSKIHLKLRVEGREFVSIIEPEKNLNHTVEWDFRDSYGMKVYGRTTSSVLVGYEYSDCAEIIWEKMRQQVDAHEIPSGIKNCDMDIHHKLDVGSSILYYGTGDMLEVNVRNTNRAKLFITETNKKAKEELENPVVLARGPKGSIFVGTYAFVIQYFKNTLEIKILLELDSMSSGIRYHMDFDHLSGDLFVSLPNDKKIVRINPESKQMSTVAGNGRPCLGNGICGDGSIATKASLSYPKVKTSFFRKKLPGTKSTYYFRELQSTEDDFCSLLMAIG